MLNSAISESAVDQYCPEQQTSNLATLHLELDWLDRVIDCVICQYLKHEGHQQCWEDIPLPQYDVGQSIYADKIEEWSLTIFDRLALALVLAPHLRPQMLDIFFSLNQLHNRSFTEFGGVTDKAFSGFLPTGQTLVFLICGNNPEWRHHLSAALAPDNRLMAEQILELGPVDDGLPMVSGLLSISGQWLQYFLTGEAVRPELVFSNMR